MKSSNPPCPHWLVCALATSVTLSMFPAAAAETVAHWRFDEGPAGSMVEHPQVDVVLDSSGNGNHLRTWADYTAPSYSEDTPFGSIPLTGEPNDFSMNFRHGNRDLYSEDKPLNTHVFSAITLEASFKPYDGQAVQVILGKDGQPNPEEHGAQPIALKLVEGRLEALITDGAGEFIFIQSQEPLAADVWYSAALTATSTEMALWLKGPDDVEYHLQSTHPIDGLFAVEDALWVVGRGMWGGGFSNFFDGWIDQVRISDAALEPASFLGADPDPAAGQGTLLELSTLHPRSSGM